MLFRFRKLYLPSPTNSQQTPSKLEFVKVE